MSAGGRVLIVVLVLAFLATGLYYLLIAEGGVEGVAVPTVSEPPEATAPPTVAPDAVKVTAEPTPIATNTLALRIAVPASNPAGVDLSRLRQRLRDSGPDSAGNGIAGWFEVYDPDSFAENEQMHQALLVDPAEYFQDRFGLVVEPYDGILQMMLYTLPSRSVAPSGARGVDVLEVDQTIDSGGQPALSIELAKATGRRVELLTKPNVSRPCAMLVNGKVVLVPRIMSTLSNRLILAGDFDEKQLELIKHAISGQGKLVVVKMPVLEPTKLATTEPEPGSGNEKLVLAKTTTVPDTRTTKPESPTAPVPPRVVTTKTTDYVVKEGDTLSSISEMWFGVVSDWTLIAQVNPTLDPNRLSVGQVLKLPPKDTANAVAPDTSSKEYTVRSGDSLATIAKIFYGSDHHWKVLYEANRAVIGDDAADLKVGVQLTIPTIKKDAP